MSPNLIFHVPNLTPFCCIVIILGGTYCQKMVVEQTLGKREKNMERMKEYNKFVNEKDQQINSKHKLYEDYIFQALARITGRQILLIIGSKNYVQKKDFVHLGKTTFRNPIIIGYDLDKKSYHWLGLKTTYKHRKRIISQVMRQ